MTGGRRAVKVSYKRQQDSGGLQEIDRAMCGKTAASSKALGIRRLCAAAAESVSARHRGKYWRIASAGVYLNNGMNRQAYDVNAAIIKGNAFGRK